MKIIRDIRTMQRRAGELKREGLSIGFVPTMGALHEGHLSLIRGSKKENDITCVSIFVNPIQFGPAEDFSNYPRPARADIALCKKEGVDFLFMPSPGGLYGSDFRSFVEVAGLSDVLCGASRKGHFRGVATVVAKLFNIAQPDRAYFGQKDCQQAVIITRMARELNFPVKIRVMPIVRSPEGLALSSRNAYLSAEQKVAALVISRALSEAETMVRQGKTDVRAILRAMRRMLAGSGGVAVEYLEAVDFATLVPVRKIRGRAAILIAARVGKTRLIDNIIVSK